MTTIKEKLASVNDPPEVCQSILAGKVVVSQEYTKWIQDSTKVRNLVEVVAFLKAEAEQGRIKIDLYQAQSELDKAQDKVKKLQQDFNAVQHTVSVLGAVEVP